jgi:hypothetical protein
MIFTVTDGFAARPPRPAAARDPDRSLRDIRVEDDVTFRVTCGFYYISSESPGTVRRTCAARSADTGHSSHDDNAELAEPLNVVPCGGVGDSDTFLGYEACAGRVKMV